MATKTEAPIFATRIDLPEEVRSEVIALLNQQLANGFDLFSQTKQAHWNVKGMDFIQLHKLFDDLAALLLGYVDMLAERITALGGTALGTVQMAAEATELPDLPVQMSGGRAFVAALSDCYGQYAEDIRAAIDTTDQLGDMASSDLFTEIVRGIDKSLYFLEAHLRD